MSRVCFKCVGSVRSRFSTIKTCAWSMQGSPNERALSPHSMALQSILWKNLKWVPLRLSNLLPFQLNPRVSYSNKEILDLLILFCLPACNQALGFKSVTYNTRRTTLSGDKILGFLNRTQTHSPEIDNLLTKRPDYFKTPFFYSVEFQYCLACIFRTLLSKKCLFLFMFIMRHFSNSAVSPKLSNLFPLDRR